MGGDFSVVPMLATQWRELRALRLEMLADSPLAYVEALESAERLTELWLEVHEANPPAQAFYRRRGYALTGTTRPYDLDPSGNELEMHRTL